MIILLAALSFLYLVFLVWLRNGLGRSVAPSNSVAPSRRPPVSVVVAARNEEQNIAHLLNSLLAQDYPRERLEIIIANDNSADRTGEIIDSFSSRHPQIKHLLIQDLPPNWSPKKWALSKAIEASSGEILLFTDADCTAGAAWIASMSAPFSNPNMGLVAGPSPLEKDGRLSKAPSESERSRWWDQMLLMDSLGQDALAAGGLARELPLTCSGRNLAIRRTAFDAVRGYNEFESFFSGDDDLMMHKIKSAGWMAAFRIDEAAQVKSAPPSNLSAFLSQRLRFASKGKAYYQLPFVNQNFRWILPLIFLVNIAVLAGQITFLATFKSEWLMPWFLKMLGDGILIATYTSLSKRQFNAVIFLLDEMWHSFYVVTLGILGSFIPITWKGRRKGSRIA